jgi:predicted enzyme related to lactoylglutathione lyase
VPREEISQVEMKLELVPVPVTDVDRAKAFLRRTVQGLHLVVADIVKAPEELLGRGVDIGEITDVGGGVKYPWFSDPDGNSLALQEMPWRTGDAF